MATSSPRWSPIAAKSADRAQHLYLSGRRGGLRIEVALQWTESHEETSASLVNGIPTTQGGARTSRGCAAAVVKAVRSFIETANLAPKKGVTLTAERTSARE